LLEELYGTLCSFHSSAREDWLMNENGVQQCNELIPESFFDFFPEAETSYSELAPDT